MRVFGAWSKLLRVRDISSRHRNGDQSNADYGGVAHPQGGSRRSGVSRLCQFVLKVHQALREDISSNHRFAQREPYKGQYIRMDSSS